MTEDATEFVNEAEQELAALNIEQQRAAWIAENFITWDTQILVAEASEKQIRAGVRLAQRAAQFDAVNDRKLELIKLALNTPGPSDPAKTAEMAKIAAEMDAMYGAAKVGDLDVEAITKIMQTSRDESELRDAWKGWHSIARPMKPLYSRFVDLTNEGARGLGYADAGAMWRAKYDMHPDAFSAEMDRLWDQVKPLYYSLYRYVRTKLSKHYGADLVPNSKPMPAHIFGNIWAQEWGSIFDLVAPQGMARGYDLTKILEARSDIDAVEMVRIGERFFTSLGFEALPATFYERSLFTRPRDREVVCHASAWDIDDRDDLRVKMCISKTEDYFQTIHHELGHNFYQRAYKDQPFLYRNSANDAFHEAIGDTIALSVTPSYLVEIGLLDEEPPESADIPLLLREALDKIAFLPFGLMIDKWRWQVFSGAVTPENYNRAWWDLRLKYQGIVPPEARGEEDFDAGAKYHIPANVPYARYFLARILQFQFHRALSAGLTGPLNRRSIYKNKAAGERLIRMLEMGASRPWPDALEALTGEREMDASAMLEYFAPLKAWLDSAL
jgi:peptidyl-dipeptidase A